MNYYKQVLTVTLWEYRRFFKLKNELLGIVIMLIILTISYFGGKYAASVPSEKPSLIVLKDFNPQLTKMLSETFIVKAILPEEKEQYLKLMTIAKKGQFLLQNGDDFVLHAWKKPEKIKDLRKILNNYRQMQAMQKIGLSTENLTYVLSPAGLEEDYLYETGSKGRSVMAYFFSGLMILAVFLSFAYQFTAITGEKQLKITEQIVSAIKPQVWMDGKILGITLTGLSSMFIYSFISILGGILFFQFTGASMTNILQFLHLPSILLFLAFTLMGILLWNAFLAAIASMITDPNNSGKSSAMLLPVLFVVTSFLVIHDPDNGVSVFLSWFPLTSSTAMPMRWVATEVGWWQLAGSFAGLVTTFYLLRKLAAKIFHVSILMSGKEPTLREVIKLAKAD
jgi:ABC-2 type transport system permease protein